MIFTFLYRIYAFSGKGKILFNLFCLNFVKTAGAVVDAHSGGEEPALMILVSRRGEYIKGKCSICKSTRELV